MKNPNTLFIILTALVVSGGAYAYFFINNGSEAPLTKGVVQSPEQIEFQALVAQLTPVTLETTIFGDARLLSLEDLTTAPVPENIGRTDPFATVSGARAQ